MTATQNNAATDGILPIHNQDRSINETVDFNKLVDYEGGVEPTSFAGVDFAYRGTMEGPNGEVYRVTFGFSQSEDRDDMGELPWDAAHVVRIERD